MDQPTPIPEDLDDLLGGRDVVSVAGPDALSYLQSQISQDLNGMQPSEARWTFVLDPTGKVECLARVTFAADNRYDLDTDAGFGAALVERLNRFKIRVDAEIALLAEGDIGLDQGAEAARIESGWPRMGVEIVPGKTIPAGTGLTQVAVCFTKGCYPGQELVERMDSRAAVAPQALRKLMVDAATKPGDAIFDDDGTEAVGTVTSVGRNAGSATFALGWVKRFSNRGEVVQFG